ncbi:leucine-rich repeat extensin-like protein 3 [Iris pallida]|uniref:Leucine-rich repeat extensin-like protein 3 n=1 Tax=Iris pallida TaxID=29817 RepID=A0AAX6DMV5_IRIPA|nr:leucine-rich repeat extensin-like protein 3 [Iris pallida]
MTTARSHRRRNPATPSLPPAGSRWTITERRRWFAQTDADRRLQTGGRVRRSVSGSRTPLRHLSAGLQIRTRRQLLRQPRGASSLPRGRTPRTVRLGRQPRVPPVDAPASRALFQRCRAPAPSPLHENSAALLPTRWCVLLSFAGVLAVAMIVTIFFENECT